MNLLQQLMTGPKLVAKVDPPAPPKVKREVGNSDNEKRQAETDERYRQAFKHFGWKAGSRQLADKLGITRIVVGARLRTMEQRKLVKIDGVRESRHTKRNPPFVWEWIGRID